LSMNISDICTLTTAAAIPPRKKTLQESGSFIFEVEHRAKDGKLIPVEVNATVIEYEGKTAVLSVQRDLRERKKRESLVNRMMNTLPHPAYLVTKDRLVVAANKSALDFGIVPGQSCHLSVCKSKKICSWCKAGEALKLDKTISEEVQAFGNDYLAYWIPVENGLYLHYFINLINK